MNFAVNTAMHTDVARPDTELHNCGPIEWQGANRGLNCAV
jgi:hypothetical protein